MRYYPAFLDLAGKRVLVVGGGRVAERKVVKLLNCDAKIVLVSPAARPRLKVLAGRKKISWVKRGFAPVDLKQKDLVICATDDEGINRSVSGQCKKRRIWVNVVDRPSLCTFIVPSTVQRKDVTFAVSTGGSSPAMAKFLRKKIGTIFGKEVGAVAEILKKQRSRIIKLPTAQKKKFLKTMLNDRIFNGND